MELLFAFLAFWLGTRYTDSRIKQLLKGNLTLVDDEVSQIERSEVDQ